MKHNSLISANGLLHNPLASTTVKSSFLTAIFKPLLMLFLLVMGSSVVWGVDYYVVGEGWTSNSENADWGKKGNNNFKMTKSGDVWYYKMNNISSSTNLQIKIRPSDDTDGWDKHLYYGANHDTQNRGNVTLVESTNAEDKRRFAFQPSENSDVYLYTDGSQVWANAVPAGSSLSGKTIRLQGDLWTGTDSYGWGIATQSPTLQVAPSGEYASTAFYLPVPTTEGADKYVQTRFEIVVNGTKVSDLSISVNGATNASTDKAKTIAKVQGNQSSRVKYVQVRYYANHQAITTISDAPAMTGDWYLYIDKTLKGQFVNGQLIVNDLPADNGGGYHSIYVAQRDDLANVGKEIKTTYPQGIAWLGGLYIDTENSSSGISWKKGCYGDATKFSNLSTFPLINGTTGTGDGDKGNRLDARGGFKLPSSGNTMFSLNNGVITIKKQGDYTSAVTFTDQSYLFFNKAQDGHGNYPQDNAHCYFYVWNANTSAYAYSEEAFYWDTNILIAKMPAGNWTHCILFRRNTAEKKIDGCWNKTGDIQLEDGKNYLTSTEATTWQNYTPRFYIASENGAISGGGNWNWNGNGTLHVGSFTKELSDGTYKFKVTPYVNSSGSTNTGWGTELNMDRYNSTLSNVSCWDGNNNEIWFNLTETKDVTIAVSANGVTVNAEDPVVPVTNYTVRIHPNGGTAVSPLSVGEGQTINSISSTYGNGTAKWYKDENLTQEFILGISTVTSDMDLYAKWGVSGNFYIGGDLWMHEKNGNNWAFYSTMAMTTTDGVASVTYIAPKGRNRFEILNTRSSWSTIANQGSELIAASTPTLSWAKYGPDNYYHFVFDLDAPKKVTIRYNGKVSITAEDYDVVKTGWTVVSPTLFGHGTDDDANTADNGAFMSGYNVTEGQMNENGERVFRNVNPGTYKFWIGKYNTNLDKTKQQIEVFGAANVDQDNSSLSGYGSLADNNNAHINLNIPQDDKLHRRVTFTLTQKADIKIAFDGGKIKVNVLPTHTVTFKNGETTFTTAQVFDGNVATAPASNPEKAGHEFTCWDWNFTTPITGDQIINAQFSYKAIESVSLNKSSLTLFENSTSQTLTASYLPAEVIGVTYSWSVSPAGVVNVVDGVVSVVGPGTATITCTATDQESHSQTATCAVTVHAGEGCVMEEQDIFSHTILGNSTTGGSASNNLPDGAALNAGMEPTCRKIKMYYGGLTSEFTADEGGVVKAKSGLSDHSDEWYEIKGGSNANSYDGNFYYLKNVATGGYITRGNGEYGNNSDWYYYTTITTPTNGKNNLYQFIYTKKDDQDSQKRICSVWNYSGMNSNQTYGLHRRNQDWADNYSAYCPNPMIVFGRGEHQGNSTINVNFTVVEESATNPDYLSTPIVYDTRSYYRFAQDAAISMTLDKKLREEDKIVVYCYNPSNAASNGGLYINNNVSAISIPANSAIEFEYVALAADADQNAIAVKSDDNNFCVAAVNVLRSLPVAAEDPELAWSAPTTYYATIAAGNFTFAASSAKSSGAISYTSSDETVATVVDGVVTPLTIGTTTITASIEQYLCFGESSIQYNVVVEPSLQEAIDATPGGGTLTLTHDYNDNAVIDKAITINGGGHTIGDLKIENTGDLTLGSGLTVRDFTICAKAGNSSIQAASGQVRNATNLTVNGNAYFLYTVDPSGKVHYGWYDFTVPFPVNAASGIKGIQKGVLNENFAYGPDYAIMDYNGAKQAQGQYPYKKFSGVMQPNQLYSITLDDDYNYDTLRMQKTAGPLVASDNVTLHEYLGDGIHKNWNGVGNGTLHHADAGISGDYVQVYQSGDKTFLTVKKKDYSFVVGTAFMVQEAGTMTLNQATHGALLAPSRYESAPATAIQIAREGQPFSDQLFISASETGGQAYTPGTDLAKAGTLGSANVPQIWTTAYNNPLCVHEAQLINGEASYNLSLYAPAADTYTLTSQNIPADYSLYLTQNGTMLTELNGTYTLDLNKGITTEYGLLLVETYKTPTGIEESGIRSQESGIRKILHNGVLYILHNGKIYNAQGGKVCYL